MGKGKARGTMRWQWDVPCLALQWIDNKVVSMITTSGIANDTVEVDCQTKSGGVLASGLCNVQSVYECGGLI